MLTSRLALAATLLLAPTASLAASSDWHHVEGGSIRIVTSGQPDSEGVLRGALEIRLKPGWKTYWRDPGSSGVPPSLDVTVGDEKAAVEIGFPAPTRFDDGYAMWAGYDRSIALALTFRLPADAKGSARVAANAFLGVCETICIPLQAELTIDPREDADDPEHAAAVAAAFAALPEPARADFGARPGKVEGETIMIEATLPDDVEVVDLFVAGTDNLALGVPERVSGSSTFSVPVLRGLDGNTDEALTYTLVTSGGAVTGSPELP